MPQRDRRLGGNSIASLLTRIVPQRDRRLGGNSIASCFDSGTRGNTATMLIPTRFDDPVSGWQDIPGWFTWRDGQQEAAAHFPDGSRFVEVGLYLGRSLCSLLDVIRSAGRRDIVIGVDTCRGSGPEGRRDTDAHGGAVAHGGGTMAGLLHRNVIACGFADDVSLLISDSVAAAGLFADSSLSWVHLDARHDYDSIAADIGAWAPKVVPGGWLSGDDYHETQWPGVVAAVRDLLPSAAPWSVQQWRWVKPD